MVGRAFLVEHRGVLTLVDTGSAGSARRVLTALEAVGRAPDDVRQIVLTHSHGDHAGEGARLRELTGAPVLAGAADVEAIAGRAPYAHAPRAWGRAVYGWLARFPRFEVDRGVTERTEIDGGLVVLPAPGHTAGHLAVWAPDDRALMAGDAVWNVAGFRPSWRAFTQDPERNRETVRELADLPSESVFTGHGPPIRRGGRSHLRALAGR